MYAECKRRRLYSIKSVVSQPHGSAHDGSHCFVRRQNSARIRGTEFRGRGPGSEREKRTKVCGQTLFRANNNEISQKHERCEKEERKA